MITANRSNKREKEATKTVNLLEGEGLLAFDTLRCNMYGSMGTYGVYYDAQSSGRYQILSIFAPMFVSFPTYI